MNKKYKIVIIVFLIVSSCMAFGRIACNNFINLDDNVYITGNVNVQSGFNKESIKWAATTVVSGNWHPLTLLSHMLDWKLFGANPAGHHLVSLLLHIGAVIFLFLFLYKTTNSLWLSAFAAVLFALHPLRVESVAWAAERKDVLSMFFGMACIYAYSFYVEKYKLKEYFLCLILFALSLMSKPMLVTLPFVLMLLDYWPLNRWQKKDDTNNLFSSSNRMIGEKIPFIILAVASCIITLWAQNKGGSLAPIEHLSFFERATNAIISYITYLWKIFWPFNLAAFYPFKQHSLLLWPALISLFMLIAITIFAIYVFRKMPFLFVGWFWYLGTLVPVIGLVQVGSQAMADRYTYLPSIGIFVGLAWSIPFLFTHAAIRRNILFPASIAILIILTFLTFRQCAYWKDSFEIWNHALHVTDDNFLAYNSRGITYGEIGQYQRAIDDFDEAIRLNHVYFKAYNNRGFAYFKLGEYQLAISDYNEAIRLRPDYARAYGNRAVVYLSQDDEKSGCYDAQKACELGSCELWQSKCRK